MTAEGKVVTCLVQFVHWVRLPRSPARCARAHRNTGTHARACSVAGFVTVNHPDSIPSKNILHLLLTALTLHNSPYEVGILHGNEATSICGEKGTFAEKL